jgi:uncharacterized protein YutE (UPF0331/DUF86 family)
MVADSLSITQVRLQEVAEEYRQKGYRVRLSPSGDELPVFLQPYHPDLIAEGSRENVVMLCGCPGKDGQTSDWEELARVIQQHPGWRLEFILNSEQRQKPVVTIEAAEIRVRLDQGEELAKAGMLEAALLIAWTAVEAAMRLASVREQIELPDLRPTTIITRLYTEGIIDWEDYTTLLECLQIRSIVAHGFQENAVEVAPIDRLRCLTDSLLQSPE